jgi:hypothetical protein
LFYLLLTGSSFHKKNHPNNGLSKSKSKGFLRVKVKAGQKSKVKALLPFFGEAGLKQLSVMRYCAFVKKNKTV